jgi:hypothetical protein
VSAEDDATQRIETEIGLSRDDAIALVDALKLASIDEALDLVVGNSSVPSNLTDTRALKLLRVCRAAGRLLSVRETQVIFRLPRSGASGVIRRMEANYPWEVAAFARESIVAGAQATKTVVAGKDRYEVFFRDPAALEYANELLRRRGMTRGVQVRVSEQIIDVPRQVPDAAGAMTDPLDVWGLAKP